MGILYLYLFVCLVGVIGNILNFLIKDPPKGQPNNYNNHNRQNNNYYNYGNRINNRVDNREDSREVDFDFESESASSIIENPGLTFQALEDCKTPFDADIETDPDVIRTAEEEVEYQNYLEEIFAYEDYEI